MPGNQRSSVLAGLILEEANELTLGELCRACTVHAEQIIELVEEGILEPVGRDPTQWRFKGSSVRQARVAFRLQQDLNVNLPGAAVVLDLLEEIEDLQAQLRRML